MFNSGPSKCTFIQLQKRKENQCKNTELGEKPGQADHNVWCQEICPGKRLKHFQCCSCPVCGVAEPKYPPPTPPSQAPKASCSNYWLGQQFSRAPGGKLKTENLFPLKKINLWFVLFKTRNFFQVTYYKKRCWILGLQNSLIAKSAPGFETCRWQNYPANSLQSHITELHGAVPVAESHKN